MLSFERMLICPSGLSLHPWQLKPATFENQLVQKKLNVFKLPFVWVSDDYCENSFGWVHSPSPHLLQEEALLKGDTSGLKLAGNCAIRPHYKLLGAIGLLQGCTTPQKLTWLAGKSTMNEDVFPIEHRDFPAGHVSFQACSFVMPDIETDIWTWLVATSGTCCGTSLHECCNKPWVKWVCWPKTVTQRSAESWISSDSTAPVGLCWAAVGGLGWLVQQMVLLDHLYRMMHFQTFCFVGNRWRDIDFSFRYCCNYFKPCHLTFLQGVQTQDRP